MSEIAHMMDRQTEALQTVIREMMHQTGLKPAPLAKKAGLAHTTLTRYVSDDGTIKSPDWALSTTTLSKLCAFSGVSVLFTKDGISVFGKEGYREFAKDAEEVRWLRGWRALDKGERQIFMRQLQGLLPDRDIDDVV